MRLTRRDALAALGAVGAAGTVAGAAGLAGRSPPRADDGDRDLDGDALATLVAAAEVLFPSAVEGHRSFVETYVLGRTADRPAHRAGVAAAVATVDDAAREWYGDAYADLPAADRDAVLRELGAETAEPNPEGTVSERVRYYVVNDLLYALYSSPTGGRLVGIENPIGFPGGTASYRRATPRERDADGSDDASIDESGPAGRVDPPRDTERGRNGGGRRGQNG